MARKVILTCAVTGNAPLNHRYNAETPFPVTPVQIARAAIDSARAGASIVHIHVRDPKTGEGSRDPVLFKEVVDRIRQSGVDVVLNLTCGGGATFVPDPLDESRAGPGTDVASVAERTRHVQECLPEISSLDVTTGNQVEGKLEFVYLNTTRTLRAMAARFRDLNIKPELEAFQAGDVLFANQLIAEGLIDAPPLYQFVLGVRWAAPATPESMTYMRSLLPANANWTAFGLGRQQMPMAAQSVLLGGNIRVGLEDNHYLEQGRFATNVQLVERAAQIVMCLGESLATPEEARHLLGLKTAHTRTT